MAQPTSSTHRHLLPKLLDPALNSTAAGKLYEGQRQTQQEMRQLGGADQAAQPAAANTKRPKFIQSLIFTNTQSALSAMFTYCRVFHGNSSVLRFRPDEIQFSLGGNLFIALVVAPTEGFSPQGLQMVRVEARTQAEVDDIYRRFKENKAGSVLNGGQIYDKWGIIWKIVPTPVLAMLEDRDERKLRRLEEGMREQKTVNIGNLRALFDGTMTVAQFKQLDG